MPATTPYTTAESYDILRQLPRPAAAQKFLVDTLKANLNDHIANASANLQAASEPPLQPFKDFRPFPVNITDMFVNCVLVGITTHFKTRGHGLIDATSQVSLYLIDSALKPNQTPQPMFDRALQVVAYLQRFLSGNYDASGNQIWRRLECLSMTGLPDAEQFAGYSGVMLTYELDQLTTAKQAGGSLSLYWPAPA